MAITWTSPLSHHSGLCRGRSPITHPLPVLGAAQLYHVVIRQASPLLGCSFESPGGRAGCQRVRCCAGEAVVMFLGRLPLGMTTVFTSLSPEVLPPGRAACPRACGYSITQLSLIQTVHFAVRSPRHTLSESTRRLRREALAMPLGRALGAPGTFCHKGGRCPAHTARSVTAPPPRRLITLPASFGRLGL